MELKGKVIHISELKTGTGKKGEWQAQDFVLEYEDGRYTLRAVLSIFGAEKLVEADLHVGDIVKVQFDVDASEYKERWYNKLQVWKVEHIGNASAAAQAPISTPAQSAPAPANDGELPF